MKHEYQYTIDRHCFSFDLNSDKGCIITSPDDIEEPDPCYLGRAAKMIYRIMHVGRTGFFYLMAWQIINNVLSTGKNTFYVIIVT